MKSKVLAAAVGILFAFSVGGCTKEARQDLGEAGANVGQATEKSAEATGEVAGKAAQATGEAVKEGAQAAGQAVEKTAEATGEAVKEGAQAVERGAEHVGEAVGGAVKGATKEAADAGQSVGWTLKVKNALVADKQINASTIDVDTSGEKDTIVLKGTVPSEAAKKRATEVATRMVKEQGSKFKVKNNLTVSKGT